MGATSRAGIDHPSGAAKFATV